MPLLAGNGHSFTLAATSATQAPKILAVWKEIMIKFKNVHKHFKDLLDINGFNLEVKQGEVVVVC